MSKQKKTHKEVFIIMVFSRYGNGDDYPEVFGFSSKRAVVKHFAFVKFSTVDGQEEFENFKKGKPGYCENEWRFTTSDYSSYCIRKEVLYTT